MDVHCKLKGTDKIPRGAHVNLGVTEVVLKNGGKATKIVAGEELEVISIEHPERIQAAVDAGLITMERLGAVTKAAKQPGD